MSTLSDHQKKDIHSLWLLLVEIVANHDGQFAPTKKNQVDIDVATLRLGLTTGSFEHLVDRARRFCQITAEIEALGDPLPAFNRAGVEIRTLTNEARAAALEWQRRIRPLEKQRRELGQMVTRAAALKAESENLQKQVARYGNEVGNGN